MRHGRIGYFPSANYTRIAHGQMAGAVADARHLPQLHHKWAANYGDNSTYETA